MKILVVSHYFWPESFRINDVARSLRAAGCEVTVLTGQPNYPDGVTFPGYRCWKVSRESHEGLEIRRVPQVPRGNASAIRMAANYLSFMFSGMLLAPWLFRGRRFDAVFVYGNSPITQAFPGIVAGALHRAPVVLWVQDLWPQSLEATGYVRQAWLLRMVARMVRWIYRHCDLLLVQSRAFVEAVRPMAGSTPVEYHPNPGESSFDEPAAGPAPFTLDPGFNVVFAGNFGKLQALDTVLAAADLLKGTPGIRIVLVGSGNLGPWVKQEIERLKLDNVTLAGRFPQEQMPAILGQASALLVSLARNPILAQTVPSKVQAYLAAGRPLIASLDGEGAQIVTEAGCGVTCPAEDAPALADAIRSLAARPAEQLRDLGANGHRYYRENFEPRTLTAQLIQRLTALRAAHDSRA